MQEVPSSELIPRMQYAAKFAADSPQKSMTYENLIQYQKYVTWLKVTWDRSSTSIMNWIQTYLWYNVAYATNFLSVN